MVPEGAKELDYFNKKYERGVSFDDYLSWFPNITKQDRPAHGECLVSVNPNNKLPYIRAEASPNYLVHPFAAERAYEMLPNTKILVMLRNPVNRLVSAFNMKWQERRCGDSAWQVHDCYRFLINETTSLESIQQDWQNGLRETVYSELEMLKKCLSRAKITGEDVSSCLGLEKLNSIKLWHQLEDHSHVYRSVYFDQLQRWFKQYPASSFMIWSSEEFENLPNFYMRKMVRWLGLDEEDITKMKINGKHHKRSYVADVPSDLKLELNKFFKEHNENLFQLLQEKGFDEDVKKLKLHF